MDGAELAERNPGSARPPDLLIRLQNQEKLIAIEKIESMAEEYDDTTPTAELVH